MAGRSKKRRGAPKQRKKKNRPSRRPSRRSRPKRTKRVIKRRKAAVRPKKRPSLKKKMPKRRILKKKPVRQKKKVLRKRPLKKAAKPKKSNVSHMVPPKKKQFEKKVEEKPPRKPTLEERRELRRVVAILNDAYVRQMLIEIGGENALAIVRNFYGNSSDEELSKKLKIKISDVRATLNKLHNEGLVNYIREKDSETGWYSYSWSLNHERMKRWASSQTDRLGILGNGDGGDYYFCPTCGAATITNFESAANGDFRCERCNRLLEFIDEKRMNELHERGRP